MTSRSPNWNRTKKALESSYTELGMPSVWKLIDRYGYAERDGGYIHFVFWGLQSDDELKQLNQFIDKVFKNSLPHQAKSQRDWIITTPIEMLFYGAGNEKRIRYKYLLPDVGIDVMEFTRLCRAESRVKIPGGLGR